MKTGTRYCRNGKIEYFLDGEQVTSGVYRRGVPDKSQGKNSGGAHSSWLRRHESLSLGVHPSQVKEHREYLKGKGYTGVTVNDSGSISFDSAGQRDKLIKDKGLGDYSSGGGSGTKGGSIPDERQPRKPGYRETLDMLRKQYPEAYQR